MLLGQFVVVVVVALAGGRVWGLVEFDGALEGVGLNREAARAPAVELATALPVTSFIRCQEWTNEGAASVSSQAHGPARSCHLQGVCVELRGAHNVLHLSRHLRVGSEVPQMRPGEPYFGTLGGMRATNAAAFHIQPFAEPGRANYTIAVLRQPTLLLRRYMGHNTMHVLHDDFLPALATILQHPVLQNAPTPADRLLLALDDFFPGDSDELLAWLGSFWTLDHLQASVRWRARLPPAHELDFFCFEDVVAGADAVSTSWYHYGFEAPQGPLALSAAVWRTVAANVRAAGAWVRRGLHVSGDGPRPFTVALVSRTRTRLMTNEAALVAGLRAAFPGGRVLRLRAEEAALGALVAAVARADVLVGMHGALLALTAFLPPGARLVELFPFGVPADNYTPFRTLAALVGVDYRVWVNPREEAPFTRGHPEADFSAGGLAHLPASYAAGVVATKTVPPHVCCYSPFWMYRIFQDTHVDVDALVGLVRGE